MGAHAGNHFHRLYGFGHIVQSAGVEAFHHMLCFSQAGHEHHRHMAHIIHQFDAAAGFKTVDTGHDGIQQNNVRHNFFQTLNRGQAVGCHQHGITGFGQGIGQQRQIFRHIIHDQGDITFQRGPHRHKSIPSIDSYIPANENVPPVFGVQRKTARTNYFSFLSHPARR